MHFYTQFLYELIQVLIYPLQFRPMEISIKFRTNHCIYWGTLYKTGNEMDYGMDWHYMFIMTSLQGSARFVLFLLENIDCGCTTVNIYEHGTNQQVWLLIKVYTVPPRCVFFLKSMINNPEFCQFILQVQSGVIYFYNLIIFFRNPTVQNLSQFHSLVSSQKTDVEMDAPRFWGISNPICS